MNDSVWVIVASIAPLVFGAALPFILWGVRRAHIRATKALAEGGDLRKQLQTSQKFEIFGALASGLVHDLNNILMVVKNDLEMALWDRDLAPATRSKLERIQETAVRGSEIMAKVLKFNRGGGTSPVYETADLRSFLTEMQGLLRTLLPKAIKLEIKVPSEPTLVRYDKTLMFQVVMNLAVNAKDAIGENKGVVSIALQAIGHTVVLAVTDTGHGIPEAIREEIFKPMFTTKPEGKGTGLGLGIVQDAVRSMAGSIRVDSAVGQGTTFTLTFPVAQG